MELSYFVSKKNGNYVIPCKNGMIIGHSSLSPEEFEAGVANKTGRWYEKNYLVGFDSGISGTIKVKDLNIPRNEDTLPELAGQTV
jgi:hypothetical protein